MIVVRVCGEDPVVSSRCRGRHREKVRRYYTPITGKAKQNMRLSRVRGVQPESNQEGFGVKPIHINKFGEPFYPYRQTLRLHALPSRSRHHLHSVHGCSCLWLRRTATVPGTRHDLPLQGSFSQRSRGASKYCNGIEAAATIGEGDLSCRQAEPLDRELPLTLSLHKRMHACSYRSSEKRDEYRGNQG